ncbi:hypothetical protein TMA_146 [Thermus phage TMA]|uniref:hypothetical protein n=1 Tax=Thermus phage TMA TaxID=699370 RepID=UPI00021AADFE|nr:hypothetical protein TMA_146 [Thermus phage TMA]BAK53834.1 hypothetical protein TMA_146 [Thermus phage TMA]
MEEVMKKVKVKFNPRTTLRVAYKGHIYRLSTEDEGQFVELPISTMGKKEAKELLEHLKNIGILSSYDTEVVEDKEEVNVVPNNDVLMKEMDNLTEEQDTEKRVEEEQNTEEPAVEKDTTEKPKRKRGKKSK